MPESRCLQGIWSSPWIFIFAASGSAVGLGNIWKFPYVLGQNGGGAFFVGVLLVLVVGWITCVDGRSGFRSYGAFKPY
ncbi:hypothetical protein [Marinomonas pontica]|uniref:hypothetical protein n=1 Tax=Marinomonas pontica TaxID=264739 RepID=UPI003908901D